MSRQPRPCRLRSPRAGGRWHNRRPWTGRAAAVADTTSAVAAEASCARRSGLLRQAVPVPRMVPVASRAYVCAAGRRSTRSGKRRHGGRCRWTGSRRQTLTAGAPARHERIHGGVAASGAPGGTAESSALGAGWHRRPAGDGPPSYAINPDRPEQPMPTSGIPAGEP